MDEGIRWSLITLAYPYLYPKVQRLGYYDWLSLCHSPVLETGEMESASLGRGGAAETETFGSYTLEHYQVSYK